MRRILAGSLHRPLVVPCYRTFKTVRAGMVRHRSRAGQSGAPPRPGAVDAALDKSAMPA
jgi:hypothetical protein